MSEVPVVLLGRLAQVLPHQKIACDLMMADEVGNMKRDECLVRIAGVPVEPRNIFHPNIRIGNGLRIRKSMNAGGTIISIP